MIVADDPGTRVSLRTGLERRGHQLIAAAMGHEALDLLPTVDPDIVILGASRPDLDGIGFLRTIKELCPEVDVILLDHHGEPGRAVECFRAGAFDVLEEPVDLVELLGAVDRALDRRGTPGAAALHEASRAIFANREPGRLPEVIVRVAREVMAADDVSLMVPDTRGRLALLCSHRLDQAQSRPPVALGESVAGRVAVSREPALLPNGLGGDPRFAGLPGSERVRSSIVYPLVAGERLLGVLNISRVDNPRPFRRRDLGRASMLAAEVALALENVHLLQRLASSERLAAIGYLAASVAHEVNNPVTCILAGSSYLHDGLKRLDNLARRLEDGADLEELRAWWREQGGMAALQELWASLGDVEQAAASIHELARDLRFLGRSEDQPCRVDLNDALRSALRVAGAELRGRATVVTRLGPDVEVHGRQARLSQVFLNLLINAVQAFGQSSSSGNQIVVTSKRRGPEVIASVTDNGPGIPPHLLPRVAEPFFTTKAPGVGTGLGLSISREIARGHGGDLLIESPPGQGTTLTLVLPAAHGDVEMASGTSRTSPGARSTHPGRRAEADPPAPLLRVDAKQSDRGRFRRAETTHP